MTDDRSRRDFGNGDPIRIGVLGYGNIGAAFVDLVDAEHEAIYRRSGIKLEVVAVATREIDVARTKIARPERLCDDAKLVVDNPDVDLVVELMGGINPARSLIEDALVAKKPVVTANKQLLANCGSELFAVAKSSGQDLFFEASVAGAIPLLRALRVSLGGEHIHRVIGIVNGTTNYILSEMSDEKIDYGAALSAAQGLGYAEADPTADVEGYDAASKATILAGLAFNAQVALSDVHREGINNITLADIEFARQLGYVVKLLAVVEQFGATDSPDREVAIRVHPAMVSIDHPLAGVRGPFNAVFVEGDASGELMFYGRGAGGRPTASAVLGDVLEAAEGLLTQSRQRATDLNVVKIRPIDQLTTQYYISIDVSDQPGVLGEVAGIFGRSGVSIRSMEQVGLSNEARLVFLTHTAREADVQATLASLAALKSVRRVGGLLRVIGPEQSATSATTV